MIHTVITCIIAATTGHVCVLILESSFFYYETTEISHKGLKSTDVHTRKGTCDLSRRFSTICYSLPGIF